MERIGGEVERELGAERKPRCDPARRAHRRLAGRRSATRSRGKPGRSGSRRDGTLHVAAASSTWAHELDLLQDAILDGLRARLGDAAPHEGEVRGRPDPGAADARRRRRDRSRFRPIADVPPEIAVRGSRGGLGDRRSGAPRARRAGGSSEPGRGPGPAATSDTLTRPRNMAICRAFLMAEAAYTAKDITVLEGLEPGPSTTRDVHRVDGLAWPASPRLRGGRQRGRRGARGPKRPRRRHDPSGQLGDRSRRRRGHPGRRDR